MLLAAASEPQRGWGGPVALVVAVGLFYLFTLAYAKIKNPSPPPPGGVTPKPITAGQRRPRPIAAKPEPRVDPDPELHETKFPNRDAADDKPWWGRRIKLPDGSTVVRNIRHVARTGESPPPELPAPPPPRDDLDDALDFFDESEDR